MTMQDVKNIIRDAGLEVSKGIGSEFEFFVSDDICTITCYYIPAGARDNELDEFEALSSIEDAEGYRTTKIEKQEILNIVNAALKEEQNCLANGGECLC